MEIDNGKSIETFPNSYTTTVYFEGVPKYYPKRLKYLATDTVYKRLN